jgi:type IV secretory pathway VirB10-like protein
MADANIRLDGQGDLRDEPEGLLELEHPGGGRFNRLILIAFVAVAIVSGVVVALGVESSGTGQSAVQKPTDDPGASARDNGEIADLAAHGGRAVAAPTFVPPPAVVASVQAPFQQAPPRPPSRYAQWAEEKYMKALESPQMVSAFHAGGTLEIARANGQQSTNFNTGSSSDPAVTLQPPASAFSLMAGSVIPAVLVSGINSDLPGPILAQSVKTSSTALPENTCWVPKSANSSACTRTPRPMVSNASRSHGSGSSSRTPRA